MIQQTSLMAYREIKLDGTIGKQASRILNFVRYNTQGFTRNEISRYLKIPINAVCGRVRELIKSEYLKTSDMKEDPITRKMNYVVRAI